jgi:hypothetical protein
MVFVKITVNKNKFVENLFFNHGFYLQDTTLSEYG